MTRITAARANSGSDHAQTHHGTTRHVIRTRSEAHFPRTTYLRPKALKLRTMHCRATRAVTSFSFLLNWQHRLRRSVDWQLRTVEEVSGKRCAVRAARSAPNRSRTALASRGGTPAPKIAPARSLLRLLLSCLNFQGRSAWFRQHTHTGTVYLPVPRKPHARGHQALSSLSTERQKGAFRLLT